MAAHIDGKGIITQDAAGLAQKGGATWSHVLIAKHQDEIRTTRVSMAAADVIIGCDPIVTASKETALRMRQGRTRVALNSHGTPTAAFVKNGNWENPAEQCLAEITQAVGVEGVGAFDADAMANQLMGDTIYVNPMILGYAWQKGWIPLRRESIVRAMELNGVQVQNNQTAFEWGRHAAHDAAAVQRVLTPAQVIEFKKRDNLDTLIERRVAYLTDYQNAAYAQSYLQFVGKVQQAESALGKTLLTETVARYLFKLMAYKDEYEVARLHTDTAFLSRVTGMFEGDFKLHYHLAPPLISKQNDKGELVKQKFGQAMLTGFKVLSRLKFLRGTPLDVFGRTGERRTERALIGEYQSSLSVILGQLHADNHSLAVDVARIPEQIKGFGHVKERNLKAARTQWKALMAKFIA
jgi:indolepyruvate ferredoxin oxidoreductase